MDDQARGTALPRPPPPLVEGFSVHRCPSLPGLDDRNLSASARTVSTTNLETDFGSMSPRVSTTTLSQEGLDRDCLGLSVASMPAHLARSASTKAIDDPATAMTSAAAAATAVTSSSKTGVLAPRVTSKRRKSGRSTSCPSLPGPEAQLQAAAMWMLGAGRLRSHAPPPPHPSAEDHPEVSLEGEEIEDLPIEPRRHFPDFVPEVLEELASAEPTIASTSLPVRQSAICRTSDDDDDRHLVIASVPHQHQHRRHHHHHQQQQQQQRMRDYIDIGASPSSLVRPTMIADHHHHHHHDPHQRQSRRQSTPRLVEIKCLQWLNSLDGDR